MSAESVQTSLQIGTVYLVVVTVDERKCGGLHQDSELLNQQEQQLAARFVFAKDRHLYTVAHAMLRRSLSLFADVLPSAWCFEFGPQGRPELSRIAHPNLSQLRFNLSHSHGIAVCAITSGFDVGIDIEDTTRLAPLDVADHFFAPSEVATLRRLPTHSQSERFFQYWTLKESYLKARGMGLSLPLDQFAFELGDDGSIDISFDTKIRDEPRDWYFKTWMFRQRYRMSLGVRSCGTEIGVMLAENGSWTRLP